MSLSNPAVLQGTQWISRRTRWPVALYRILPGILLAIAHLPLLACYALTMWQRPHYRFFPVVLVGATAVLARDCRGLGLLSPATGLGAWPPLIVCWLILAAATVLVSPWLAAVSALVTILAAVHAVGGPPAVRRALPGWSFLWLGVAPPLGLDGGLIARLRDHASHLAGLLLDSLGVYHLMEGNVVRLAGRRLLVEEACSGINSLFSVVTCVAFFCLWTRRRLLHALVLIASAVAWVVLGNACRIVAVTYVIDRWGVDLTSGWSHELLGFVVFATTLGLTASTESALLWLGCLRLPRPGPPCDPFLPEEPLPAVEAEPGPTRLPDLSATRLGSWRLAGSYALLLALQAWLVFLARPPGARADAALLDRLAPLTRGDLPARWGAFVQQDFRTVTRAGSDALGEHSKVWDYRMGGCEGAVSADYSFRGWHELTACYRSEGWALQSRTVRKAGAEGRDGGGPVVELDLRQRPSRYAHVWFGVWDERGRALEPPARYDEALSLLGIAGRLHARFSSWAWGSAPSPLDPDGPCYQVQLFLEARRPLTDAERLQARAFFDHLLRTGRIGSPRRPESAS